MKRGETELTLEQLQLGFRQLRRPGWPATLEEALQHPVRSKCIKGMARQLSRAPLSTGQRPPPTPAGAPPVPNTPSQAPQRRPMAQPLPGTRRRANAAQPFDPKRAAANDRDD
jgi:hypothetical protein